MSVAERQRRFRLRKKGLLPPWVPPPPKKRRPQFDAEFLADFVCIDDFLPTFDDLDVPPLDVVPSSR